MYLDICLKTSQLLIIIILIITLLSDKSYYINIIRSYKIITFLNIFAEFTEFTELKIKKQVAIIHT